MVRVPSVTSFWRSSLVLAGNSGGGKAKYRRHGSVILLTSSFPPPAFLHHNVVPPIVYRLSLCCFLSQSFIHPWIIHLILPQRFIDEWFFLSFKGLGWFKIFIHPPRLSYILGPFTLCWSFHRETLRPQVTGRVGEATIELCWITRRFLASLFSWSDDTTLLWSLHVL
jgi:hypothetical protein